MTKRKRSIGQRVTGLQETPEGRLRRVLQGDIRDAIDVRILQEHIERERDKIKATWSEEELRRRADCVPDRIVPQTIQLSRFISSGGTYHG